MSDKIMFFGALSAILFAAGSAPQLFGSEKAERVNPASVYCAQSGYKSETRTRPDGSQYRACILPDGKECEEWTFFRTECGAEFRNFPEARENTFCKTDADCACGTQVETGKCFYGSKLYVNTEKQCPDFCSGFSGNLTIQCVDNECRQDPRKSKN